MAEKPIEKRICERFTIPEASISYKRRRFLFQPDDFDEEDCPLIDLSRGGLRFLSEKSLRFEAVVTLELRVLDHEPLTLIGEVVWKHQSRGQDFMHQIGVKLNPYGSGKGDNPPECLERIKELEKEYGSCSG